MKNRNLILGALTMIGTATLSAQDMNASDVPSNLTDTFQQAYPNATDVEWEKEGDSYKVEFDIDRNEQEIWYSADGNTAKTEKEIGESDLPQAITSAISNDYTDYKIDSIEMTEENGETTYEVELEKGWYDEKEVLFSADGKVLNESDD